MRVIAAGLGGAVVGPVVDEREFVDPEPDTVVGVGVEPVGFAERRGDAGGPADTEQLRADVGVAESVAPVEFTVLSVRVCAGPVSVIPAK